MLLCSPCALWYFSTPHFCYLRLDKTRWAVVLVTTFAPRCAPSVSNLSFHLLAELTTTARRTYNEQCFPVHLIVRFFFTLYLYICCVLFPKLLRSVLFWAVHPNLNWNVSRFAASSAAENHCSRNCSLSPAGSNNTCSCYFSCGDQKHLSRRRKHR